MAAMCDTKHVSAWFDVGQEPAAVGGFVPNKVQLVRMSGCYDSDYELLCVRWVWAGKLMLRSAMCGCHGVCMWSGIACVVSIAA